MPVPPVPHDEREDVAEVDVDHDRHEPADLGPSADAPPWIGLVVILAALLVAMLALGAAIALLGVGPP
jgi:hypothetical protein